MPAPEDLEKAARDMNSAWEALERGERLTKAQKDHLRPGVKSGISMMKEAARKMRERAGKEAQ